MSTKSASLNCLVVDDDDMVRIDIGQKISDTPFLHLAGSCASALEAAAVMQKEKIDLVFLDILMPEMTGLQFMESMGEKSIQVIFITSEKDYAAQAFDLDVTDFLVKPVSMERFLKAVMRASSNVKTTGGDAVRNNHLFVKSNGMLVRILTSDILYAEAMADYVNIHTADARHTVHSTMKSLQDSLPEENFFRVHNSFIINLDRITRIEDNLVIIDKKPIPVSRSRIRPLMQRLNTIS
ncbi:MAG TPA: LytTR family DNA-binding domain-containing protein [Bacteroidia bacterium]|nr:LytTR family DNA-binding domain-containing protein [Bacteroidia bacterium]